MYRIIQSFNFNIYLNNMYKQIQCVPRNTNLSSREHGQADGGGREMCIIRVRVNDRRVMRDRLFSKYISSHSRDRCLLSRRMASLTRCRRTRKTAANGWGASWRRASRSTFSTSKCDLKLSRKLKPPRYGINTPRHKTDVVTVITYVHEEQWPFNNNGQA